MRDFTLMAFRELLNEIFRAKYNVVTFEQYLRSKKDGKIIILRHDVDKNPLRSLRTAEMENELEINGTYYFRVRNGKCPGKVIGRVAQLGHEIGYHYDDLNATGGIIEEALASFQSNLAKLRELFPVRTICMHGSPLSRHDNIKMWASRSYKEFGIIGEPYLDVNFDEVMYLTDTGRRWDGDKVSIRDKVEGRTCKNDKRNNEGSNAVGGSLSIRIHSTMDIIWALKEKSLPDRLMLTIHPQRWSDNCLLWTKEMIWQNIKNQIKYIRAKRIIK
jgi:hypothetical protein